MATVHLRDVALGMALLAGGLAGACSGVVGKAGSRHEVVSSDCVTCHRTDYDHTTKPHHSGLFDQRCGRCHAEDSWTPAKYQHEWPLEGKHATAPCTGCHVGEPPVYKGTSHDCIACHQADYDRAATSDAGVRVGHGTFSTECGRCHTPAAWLPATFDHTGITPDQCVDCHRSNYDATTAPPHASSGIQTTCADCHGTTAWTPSTFQHTWPLTGKHTQTPCTSCHVGMPPVYQGTPTACVGCHRADYDGTTNPVHAGNFSTSCDSCHTTATWLGATAHPEQKFPIKSGPHAGIACADCHQPPGPDGLGNANCVGCHSGIHALAVMDAKHAEAAGYAAKRNPAQPNFCTQCHADGFNRF